MKNILIIGHAQHGKDTAAEYFKQLYGFTYKSSSIAASEIFLYNKLKDKYGYSSAEECFLDRVNHRAEWYDLICEYNKNDKARLAKVMLKTSDIYVGMRSDEECMECLKQKVFSLIIGIWDYRKPLEDKSSFDINIWERSDLIIPNSQGFGELERRIALLEPLMVLALS